MLNDSLIITIFVSQVFKRVAVGDRVQMERVLVTAITGINGIALDINDFGAGEYQVD